MGDLTICDKFAELCKDEETLRTIRWQMQLPVYQWLVNNANPDDPLFRYVFMSYYVTAPRTAGWQDAFFCVFREIKSRGDLSWNNAPSYYRQALYALRYCPQTYPSPKVEASFVSKMLATINVDLPIWDENVRKALGECCGGKYILKSIDGISDIDRRMSRAFDNYAELLRVYQQVLLNEQDQCLEVFDKYFKSFEGISVTKKIDFILWILGKRS